MADERIKIILDAGMDISDVQANAKQIQNILKSFKMPAALSEDFEKQFKTLETEITKIQAQMKAGFKTKGDITGLEKSTKTINTVFGALKNLYSTFENEHLMMNVDFDTDEIKQARKDLADLQQQLKSKMNTTEFTNLGEKIKEISTLSKSGAVKNLKESFSSLDLSNVRSDLDSVVSGLTNFAKGNKDAVAAAKLFQEAWNSGKLDDIDSILTEMTPNMQKVAIAARDARNDLDALGNAGIGKLSNEVQETTQHIRELENVQVDKVTQNTRELGQAFDQAGDHAEQCGNSIKDAANDMYSFNGQVEQVKNRVKDFFSLTNSIMLFRRGVQEAVQTVKELDKAMTETAVVTDFSVGDMWDALPQYTKMANELGVSTQGVYEASTLYYQQGLQTNEVMALTSETLKMARIAGLECAEATDLMTAALRGFNMEINETNAQKINDVYSELAAITAADTQEIATAMTKTASIASSANMEFETTAALLSQIIETTREPAETAGTAMKTIIARFTEMKKASSEVINVDGEEVNVNKVEAALKSAGVALRDVNGEFRDLDDVFLELSSKWNGLDIMTQRYIATTAAGSRQQSRFIAMMQDYDRTIELVNAAYNSNGASANQFAKTQESLESKLAKLKNAWDEFLMGIANSKAIKIGVDALTWLLNVVNKLTGKSGLFKLAVAIGALKGGSVVFNKLFASMGKFGGFNLKNISQRIANFKETGSFSLKGTADTQLASKQLTAAATSAAKTQVSGATSAAKVQVEGATKAGQILIKGATEAAKIEAKGAQAENATEQNGAVAENATEQNGAVAEGVTENAGATSEVAIEEAGAAAEVVVENAGATAETAIEVSGAVVEESIEAGGSVGKNKGSKFLEQGSTWKDGFGKMWGNFKTGATAAFAAIKPLLPLIAALAAEVAILGAVWYFSDEQVETRKLEEANKLAEGLSNGLEDARSALKSVIDGRSGLQSLKDELNGLTVGTDEWKSKLLEVQAEEAKLIEQFDLKENMPDLENPELNVNGLIQIDSAGNQTITEKGWEYLEKRQEDTVKTNLAASQIAQASAERQEFELEKVQTLEEKEDEVAKGDNVVGGITGGVLGTGLGVYGGMVGYSLGIAGAGAAMSALSGTALGAKLGGALGSVVPGLGTVIGVAVGALAGAAIGYAVNEGIEELGGHGEEYKKTEAQLQKEQRVAYQKQYMAYKNALKQTYSENKNLTTEEAEVAAAINASNMDQFIAAAEDEVGKKANKDEQKLWAEYKGYTWKDNKAYDADGNEVDLSDKKAIAKELAIFKAMDAAEQNAEVIAKYLQQGGEAIKTLPKELGSSYEDFSKILSGDISADKETVDYMAKNAENNVDMAEKILEEAKTDEEKIKAIAAFTGKSEKDIKKEGDYENQMAEAIQVKAMKTQLSQIYTAQDFYEEMALSGLVYKDATGDILEKNGINREALQKLYKTLSFEQMKSLTNISEGLRNALGRNGMGGFALFDALDSMSQTEIEETINLFNKTDFSNPIQGAKALNKAVKTGSDKVAGLGKKLLEIAGPKYSIDSQFDYLISSGTYDSFSEKINELVEANGKLTSKNIKDMAESSDDLAAFLDQDGISAHGLAKAFTVVAKEGHEAMDGITSATLKAISATQTLEDTYMDIQDVLENFDPGTDSMAGMDFIKNSIEVIEELINNGEYGNPQLEKYLESIFNIDFGKSTSEMKKYFKLMKSYTSGDGLGFWKKVASSGSDLGGLLSFSSNMTSYVLNQGTTTKQLLEQLQKEFDLTELGAKSMLASLTSHSLDLSNQLKINDSGAAIKQLFEESLQRMGEESSNTIITEAEIEVISSVYGLDITEIKNQLQSLAKQEKVTLTITPELVDVDGNPLTGDALTQQLKEIGGDQGLEAFIVKTKFETEDGEVKEAIDFVASQELMTSMGVDPEEATRQLDTFVEENEGTEIGFVVGDSFFKSADEANNYMHSGFADIDQDSLNTFIQTLAGCDFSKVAAKLISDIKIALEDEIFWINLGPKLIASTNSTQADVQASKEEMHDQVTNPETFWEWLTGVFASSVATGSWSGPGGGGAAKGSDFIPHDQIALTGEEGPELVQSLDSTFHIVGVNGPQMAPLRKGDKVYPAKETKKILNGYSPKRDFRRYAKGTKGATYNRYEKGTITWPSGTTTITTIDEVLKDLEKESDKLKSKIEEINSAIKDLADNDIVDMRMVNELINQKIALQKQYKKALEQELGLLSKSTDEIWNQVKKEGNDKYIQYDEETDMYRYTDAYYAEFYEDGLPIDSEQMQKIQEQASQLNKVNSDQLANQVAIKELVDNLVKNQAENYNAERALKGRERRQTEADAEEDLIGMLPEEIQPFFQALNTAEDARLEMQEIQANKVLAENLQQQLDASYAGVPDYIKENMTFDEYSGYGIDLAKINQIEDKEAREEMLTAVQENAKILNEQYFDPLYDVKEQLSGGKLQKGILTTAKALKDFAKEVSDNDFNDGLLKVETGFKALDEALNGLIERIEDSELVDEFLNKKAIGGLGLGDKERDALLSNEKLVEFLGKSGLGPIVSEIGWGEGATNGELLSLANGFMGGALEQIGGFLNFDMMKILGGSGGLIEQGKQMVEQIVGKVAEITGALIDAWTNREDILYNFLNVLERYLHDYEVMQRYSTQLEKGRMASVDDIRQNWEQQWQSLQDQLEMQQERIETRQDQLDRSRWNPFQLISGWNPETDSLYENREIKMAFDLLISAIGMLPMGLGAFGGQLNQLYEDYDKRVQEAYEDRLAAEMAILDIEDERLELVKIGADEATEFEQKVLDALIQKEQEQIEELSRLNDAITDANSKLISTLQKNLDQIRQDRENEKKEEELGEKERRLAYLRQDTSGANMMEIKKLEEELEEGHEDYTDTLIDQKISELEKQNEAAAEQRQQQIDLLQAQLDWSQKYGLYWDAIYGMLYTIDENGNAVLNPENFDLDGNIRENSQLAQMLGTFSDRLGMSVWSSVLDNEEAKRLGRYYGAFIGNNGVAGEWADYWALLNPGADDPDYATPDPDIPEGILGVLWNIESSLRNYFIKSDGALFDGFGHMGEKIANGLGDLLGIDSLSNYDYITNSKRTDQAPLTEMLVNGGEKMAEGWMNILSRGNKTTQGLSRTENNGVETMNIHFNIGNVGENISLDDMVDKVTVAFKEMFTGKTNLLKVGH